MNRIITEFFLLTFSASLTPRTDPEWDRETKAMSAMSVWLHSGSGSISCLPCRTTDRTDPEWDRI